MAGRPLRRARLLANPPHVEDAGGSPLVYFGWKHHGKQRLVVIDEDEPDAAPGTEMYKRKEVWRTWSQRTGKRLKKPVLDEVIEGAPPHTMAFLDWHYTGSRDPEGPTDLYIDYLHVRGDMRGKGHARRLIQALIDRHPNLRILDFGKMMRKEIGHLKDYFAEKYKDRIIVIGRVNY